MRRGLSISKLLLGASALLPAASLAAIPTSITNCMEIHQGGEYVLDHDLRGLPGAACLRIHDASNVTLDCRGHAISSEGAALAALAVDSVKNFTIKACSLPQVDGYSLFVGNSLNGLIIQNTLREAVLNLPDEAQAASLQFRDNTFSNFSPATISTLGPDAILPVVPLQAGLTYIDAKSVTMPEPAVPQSAEVSVAPMDRVYPNPWRADLHHAQPITFDALAPGSSVKIFTISGRWVQTLEAPSGTVHWDRTTADHDLVASGIYLYLITGPQGQHDTGKLAIIR